MKKLIAAVLAVLLLALPIQAVLPEVPGGDGYFSGTQLLLFKAYGLETGLLDGDGLTLSQLLLNADRLSRLSGLSLGMLAGLDPAQTRILAPGDVPEGTVLGQETLVIFRGERMDTALVSDTPLALTAPEEPLVLDVGERAPIGIRPNYSVHTAISYGSNSTAVAFVDENGQVLATGLGAATVTGSLPDGGTVQRSVRVINKVHSITFSRETVKVNQNGGTKALTVSVLPETAEEPLIWASSDESVVTVDENGLLTGHQEGIATVSCTAKYSGVTASCQVKVCRLMQVALTFDDGPSSKYTMPLLDALEQHDAKATFFFVGNRLYTAPEAVKRMVAAGHELGYHTWAHDSLPTLTADQIRADYKHFQSLLKQLCGQQATVYRAPGGSPGSVAPGVIPLPHIHWSVGTRDWQTRDTELVKQAILDGLQDGAIILLHDIHATTLSGTVAALEEIARLDLDVEFVTVTELLSRDGTPPQPGHTYRKG